MIEPHTKDSTLTYDSLTGRSWPSSSQALGRRFEGPRSEVDLALLLLARG